VFLALWLIAKLVQFLTGADEAELLVAPVGWLLLAGVIIMGALGAGYWYVERRRAAHSAYAVTDRRAMIVVADRSVTSFAPAQLAHIKIADGENGLCRVTFLDQTQPEIDSGGSQRYRIGFEALPDARDAVAALWRLLAPHAPAPERGDRNEAAGAT
jgi:hypothetical protein